MVTPKLPRAWFTASDAASNAGIPETSFRRYLSDAGLKADGVCSGYDVFSIQWVRQFRAVAPLLVKAGKLAKAGNNAHAAHFRKLASKMMKGKHVSATPPAPAASKPKAPKQKGVRTLSADEAESIRRKFRKNLCR